MITQLLCSAVTAQQAALTVGDCMRYAVEHNHDIRISRLTQDNRWADRVAAIGAFLPSVSGNIGAQYNFGRAIDPETNVYTNVSTFNNGYSVSASLPLFDGFQRVNRLRAAQASVLMGNSELQALRDELALQVFEAYCNVLYYQGTVRMAGEKREQSRMTLHQTRVMCEIGQKSEADVAQMEAQLAADEYEVTRQENGLATARLSLRQLMNWPGEIEAIETIDTIEAIDTIVTAADVELPAVEAARHNVTVARHNLHEAWGEFSPTLSISGGMSTNYNKMLHAEAVGFRTQLDNNKGEYVYATLSIPVFSRLQTITKVRRQKNNLRIAEEQLAQKRDELARLRLQAGSDCEGYRRQTVQMRHKVGADSLAWQLTLRKYEEGLASGIDVQTTSATLLQSRAQLLQCRLMLALKQKLVNYYNGISLWTE